MRLLSLLLAVLMLAIPAAGYAADAAAPAAPADASAATAKPMSDADRAAIEEVIKNYLTKEHPEVIVDAIQTLQKRENATSEAAAKETLIKDHDKVYNDPNTPIAGNPKGDVVMVEFFDYQCPYCKSTYAGVEQLVKEDKNLKFVYKDFPILGEASTVASQAALASVKQGKHEAFHAALMKAPFTHGRNPPADIELVYKTAKDTGLDVDQLKKDMSSDVVKKTIQDNLDLASKLGVRGTPMFVINDQIFPGAMSYDQLKKAVSDARAAAKTDTKKP